eukprot:PhM_4_TR6404/c0_g1_i1/m.61968/K11163/DHRS1; dehydrogenase/reductase SDR family member 1
MFEILGQFKLPLAAGLGMWALYQTWRRLRVRNDFDLRGRIAVVTGGSRGVGRGVSLELGRAGATVYVLGRSRRGGRTDLPGQSLKDKALGGTIDDTADEVTRLGGRGIPMEIDCTSDDDMRRVIKAIGEKEGRIDILVNCAIMIRSDVKQTPPFWEQELEVYDSYHTVGTRSTYVMSALALPYLLKSANKPLIVNVSSGGAFKYLFNVAYGVGKAALNRIGKDMNVDLRQKKTNVAVVTLCPGVVSTERMMVHKDTFRRKFKYIDVSRGETVHYTGRSVCALASKAAKKDLLTRFSGNVFTNTQLALEYGFTDIDGRRPSDPMTVGFLFDHILPVLLENMGLKKPKTA